MSEPEMRSSEEQLLQALCDTCKESGEYQIKVSCCNCDWKGSIRLTRGHEFSRYTTPCKGCGCSTLMRSIP